MVAELLRRRRVVERAFAWIGRYHRNSRDYEHSSEATIQISSIRRMLRHSKRDRSSPPAPFSYGELQGLVSG